MKKYRNLRESTDQLTNSIFDVRTKLQLRRASDDQTTSRNLPLMLGGSEIKSRLNQIRAHESAGIARQHHCASQASKCNSLNKPSGSLLTQEIKGRMAQPSGSKSQLHNSGAVKSLLPDQSRMHELRKNALYSQHEQTESKDRLTGDSIPKEISSVGNGALRQAQGSNVVKPLGCQRENDEILIVPKKTDSTIGNGRKDQALEQRNSGPIPFTSPFSTVLVQQQCQEVSNDSAIEFMSGVFDLKSPFAIVPRLSTGGGSMENKNHRKRESDVVPQTLHTMSSTVAMNNATHGKLDGVLSYAQVAQMGMKSRFGTATPDSTPENSELTPRQAFSSAANAVVLEDLMETKLSTSLDPMPLKHIEDSDFSSAQLCSSKAHCEDSREEDRFGIRIDDMDDLSVIKAKDIVFRSKLGTGASGQVYEAEYQGGPCAVKLLNLPQSVHAQEEFEREIRLHCNLAQHPHVVRYYGHVRDFGRSGEYSGPGLVMELCHLGSLLNLVQEAR